MRNNSKFYMALAVVCMGFSSVTVEAQIFNHPYEQRSPISANYQHQQYNEQMNNRRMQEQMQYQQQQNFYQQQLLQNMRQQQMDQSMRGGLGRYQNRY